MKNLFLTSILMIALMTFISCGTSGEKAEVKEGAGEVTEKMSSSSTLNVVTAESQIRWEGTKPTGTHHGLVPIQSGELHVADGHITGGKFVMDMARLTVEDLEGDKKAGLESHLKGTADDKRNDFFDVRTFPTATFEITKVTSLEGDINANTMIYGNLTVKNQTNQIGFKANVTTSDNGLIASTDQFTFDRTKWGINFMSKSMMDDAKDNFINDNIGLKISLVAR